MVKTTESKHNLSETSRGFVNKMSLSTKIKLEEGLLVLEADAHSKSIALGQSMESAQDWHDNVAYDLLLQELDVLDSRIKRYKAALSNVEIIVPRTIVTEVGLGNTVIVQFEGEESTEKFTVLGTSDNETNESWISIQSALGTALLGKTKGSQVKLSNGTVVTLVDILSGEF